MEDLRCNETFRETGLSPPERGTYSAPLVCRAYRDPVILEDARDGNF